MKIEEHIAIASIHITKRLKFSMPLALCTRSQLLCILHLFILTCMSLVMECSGDTKALRTNHQKSSDVRDMIIELQCYAKCEQLPSISNDFSNCQDKCRIETKKLPRQGHCPIMRKAIFQNFSPRLNELSCVDSCTYDFDCPDIQKCCPSACGNQWVCMTPIGSRDVPPIPKILKYKLPRGHKVEITIATSLNSTCLYHVEARSHIGLFYSPRKFGPWHWQPVEKIAETLDKHTKWIVVAFNLKPGRWYQVRVAAINSNGFGGYSEPSKSFSLVNRPKPPKAPADLKVVSTTDDSSFLSIKIVWCPSKSNLPVEKYKIIWSRYVKFKGDSLISNESFVRNTHQFIITKLLPDTSYYIQVQAMTAIGKRRLKSEKTSILYNTTQIATSKRTIKPFEALKCSNSHNDNRYFPDIGRSNAEKLQSTEKIPVVNNNISQPYEVHFLMNRKLGMIVRISGFHPHKEKVYELCPQEADCEQREYSAIRAKKNSLEFSKLKYDTTYILKAFQSHEENNYTANRPFIFTTPKCEKFIFEFETEPILLKNSTVKCMLSMMTKVDDYENISGSVENQSVIVLVAVNHFNLT